MGTQRIWVARVGRSQIHSTLPRPEVVTERGRSGAPAVTRHRGSRRLPVPDSETGLESHGGRQSLVTGAGLLSSCFNSFTSLSADVSTRNPK